jgi:hypothetical protein
MSNIGGKKLSFKAKLRVVLQADETVVAETDDANLWQHVLMAINSGSSKIDLPPIPSNLGAMPPPPPLSKSGDALDRFANVLGLTRAEVEGACSPHDVEPFLRLDKHCWEAMKKQTGERGPSAYSPIAVASTLLALWFKAADLGNVTQAHAQAVLGTIDTKDQNPARGIDRSEWLQSRPGGTVVINPARFSRAVTVAKSFCSKKWSKETE